MKEALWFCAYTPLEVLDAAGLAPRRVTGDIEHLEEADAFLHPAFCPYVRACLVEGMRRAERGASAAEDTVAVFVNSCDAMRRLRDAWSARVGGTTYMLDMPRRCDAMGERLLAGSLLSFMKKLEAGTGREITPAKLKEAAASRDDVARHLARLSEGRSGSARMALARQAQQLPPAAFLALSGDGLPAGRGTPLLVTGNLLNPDGMAALIEEHGGWLVGVDLCNGERPFGVAGGTGAAGTGAASGAGVIPEFSGDTLEEACLSLARRYLARRHCARMLDAPERDAALLTMVRETGARGVIFASLKFCDTYLYDFPRLAAFLEKEGVPLLRLESDYQDGHAGQLSTRVEAFIEMLGD